MMKRAVTGHEGRIGAEFVRRGYVPIESNITDTKTVFQEIQEISPDIIVHCAAITDIGYCEGHDREAFETNVRGTLNVLDSFSGLFIYISTCHVFPGTHSYAYNERHAPSPLNVYGLTKWMAEGLIQSGLKGAKGLVVRASKVFIRKDILSVVERLKSGEEIEVTDLITRSFVYLPHFVDSVEEVIRKKISDNLPEELIHVAGNYVESYYGLYLQIARIFDLDHELIIPRRFKLKDEFPRPFAGGLNTNMAESYGVKLYSSHQGLEEIKDEYVKSK
jgi:dTDP-4-dehydrorhamnose reductase